MAPRLLTALLLLLLLAPRAQGHGMRTAYLEVTPNGATLRSTLPDPTLAPEVSGCALEEAADVKGPVRLFGLRCPGPLAGRSAAVRGLGPIITEAVIRVTLEDGQSHAGVQLSGAPAFAIPTSWRPSRWQVARQYVLLGVEHILKGADHLLFLLGLVVLVRRPRQVLLTETAFTVSHSLTFSLVALGLLRVSAAIAEACIALSLVLLALDVVVAGRRRLPPWQAPLTALCFGLVHGLGFAGALREVGLPEGSLGTALLGFGLGVELGQIAFLIGCLLLWGAVERLQQQARASALCGYAIGVTGSFWMFQRLCAAFFM